MTDFDYLDPETVDLATFVAMAVHDVMAKIVERDEAVAAIMERIERDRQTT